MKRSNVLRFASTAAAVHASWKERAARALAPIATGDKAPRARGVEKDSYGLAAAFRQAGLPELLPGFIFHPVRQWRFDYADPAHFIAIEIEGGIWRQGGGAHSHPTNIIRDMHKYNAATLLGWRILRYQPPDIGEALHDVRILLAERKPPCP